MDSVYLLMIIVITSTLLVQSISGKDVKKSDKLTTPTTASPKRDLEPQPSKKAGKRDLEIPSAHAQAFSYTHVVQNHGKLRKVIHVASPPESDNVGITPYQDEAYHEHNDFHYHQPSPEYDYGNQDSDYGGQEDNYSNNEFFPEGLTPDPYFGREQTPYYGPVYVTAKPILASPEYRKVPTPNVPARLSYPLFTPYQAPTNDGYSEPAYTKITYPLHVGKTYVLPYDTRPFAHAQNPVPDKSLVVYASPSPSYVISHDGETGLYNRLKFSPTVIPYTVHVNKNYVDFGRALAENPEANAEEK